MPEFTKSQKNVINYRGNLLVSASAGTGKTTVMIERIAALIEEGVDVSQMVVVTFTNLAAAEMKKRLYEKLAEKRNNPRIIEQLEKLDNAAICTIDSFCSNLLRNYFYVVDIDPSFTILDGITEASLQKTALDEVFREYFRQDDADFKKVYQIFATKRREENFRKTVKELYQFARCLPDFYGWYAQNRQNFIEYGKDNTIVTTLEKDILDSVSDFAQTMDKLATKFLENGIKEFSDICKANAEILSKLCVGDLEQDINSLAILKLNSLPKRKKDFHFGESTEQDEMCREDFAQVSDEFTKFKSKYETLSRGMSMKDLWAETVAAVAHTDKLVEILQRFEETFFLLKKQRGAVDFGDLEHLSLKILQSQEVSQSIHERYKMIFVDEYQDTNPLQEELITLLAGDATTFMVGDIKQSIYGFRGCEPQIFWNKYNTFKNSQGSFRVEELNANFRSNNLILQFVNSVFDKIMTEDFGKVDYERNARLEGKMSPCIKMPSVQIDLLLQEKKQEAAVDGIYDVTATQSGQTPVSQGEVIAHKISQFVGKAYKDKDGNSHRIGYGDIVILMRGLKDKAVAIYNALVRHNIPVVANFKVSGYTNKEVRDIINLLRAVDNPYNDIYMVGTCLSPFGGFTENQLAQIKIATQDEKVPFYTRLQIYANSQKDEISTKISSLIAFLCSLRFYSYSATVDEVAIKILEETNFHLYVQGLPNGGLRLRKMYSFIDGIKGATYSQSIEKFLSYLDEAEDVGAEEGASGGAVRIMTMHASKGLEFPIVILAGLESRFNEDSPAVVCNNGLGVATRYYDFSTMRVANTLGTTACGMFNHQKSQEEEMRLLYVAMTRAKYILDLVGTTTEPHLYTEPKRPQAATKHLDWLLSALKQQYGKIEECNGDVQITIHQNVDEVKTEADNLLCEQYTDREIVARAIAYKYPFADQTDMPSKLVSSALDREYIDVDPDRADFVLSDDGDRNFVGTAYHKVYQYANYDATIQEIEQVIAGLVNQGKVEQQYADKLDRQLIFDTLHNPQLRKLMSQGTVYHEMPFMLVAPYNKIILDCTFSDDVMLQGVIDLLVLSEKSAVVVDFKYSTHSPQILKQRYKAQLNSYRLAVQQICGIQDVDCYILSVADNKLIKM